MMEQRDFEPELIFTATRSSGPGGQNVNKVSSRVELRFHPGSSSLLTAEEKELVAEKLANRISNEGYLIISCQSGRSRLQNKELCIRKFYELLDFALKKKKPRKPSKPSRSAIEKRLQEKKRQSEKKDFRSGRI